MCRRLEVCRLVYRQMRSLTVSRPDELEDLAQAAAAEALRSLETFRGDAELSTWTYGVCHRVYLKRQRAVGRWLRRFTHTPDGQLPTTPGSAEWPVCTLERNERGRHLAAALGRLSVKHRVVVVLHDLEELTSAQVADIVGTNVGTVRSRLRDGRRRLRKVLAKDAYFAAYARKEPGEP